MTTNHKYFLDLAFKIAEKNLGKTKLNPSVKRVFEHSQALLTIGWRY